MIPLLVAAFLFAGTLLDGAESCLPVRGDKVLAGEIAPGLPVFGSLAGDEPVLPAPAAGVRRVLSPSEIRILAGKHGLEPDGPAASICLIRQTRTLEPAEIAAALEKTVAGAAEITLLDFSRYGVPLGQVLFERNGIAAAGAPQGRAVLWRGVVRTAEGRTVPIWARVTITHIAAVVVALHDVARGAVLLPADVTVEQRRRPGLAGKPVAAEQLLSRMTRRLIRAGEIIVPALTEPVPEIRAGQHVRVEVREGPVQLGLEALAERPARTGEMIWLKAEPGGRRFAARVTGPGQAEVEPRAVDRNHRRKTIEKTDIHTGADRIDRPGAVAQR